MSLNRAQACMMERERNKMKITNLVKQWLLITLLIFSSVTLFSKNLWSPPSSSATTKLPMNNEHYPEWNKTLGGTGNQQGYGIVECNNGDFAIVGQADVPGGDDALLMRTDNAGNQLWNQTFGGIMYDVAGTIIECSDGGFAITGVSFDMVEDDTWLLRTDANGNQLWNYTFTSTTRDAFNTVVELPAGGFAVAGSTGSFGAGGKDIWLIFFDASGQPTLNFTYGGAEDDSTTKIIKCHNGGYLISGVTHSYGAGMQDMWLLRINDAGDLLWNHTYGGAGWDSLYDIIECYGGGFALAGTANSSGAGSWDMMLILTDINGNSLWQKTYGGSDRDGTYNVEQLADYGFVLGGWTYSFGAGMEDIWVVRTDSYGNHLWNQTFGGAIYDECFDMTKTADGGYVLVGTTFSFGDPLDIWLLYFQDDSEPFTPPPIPLELIIVLVIIIIVIVILSILLYRRQQSKT